MGRQGVELNRIGAVPGMDGIISLLNRYRETSCIQGPRFSGSSKLAKLLYDQVHEAYDGHYDQAQDRYLD